MGNTITIKDVAKKAKVSVGTVSNVINKLDTVSEKNRTKVLEVIKKTGYKHSRVAASMVRKKTSNIGLIVPDISSPYYSDLIKGVCDTLEDKEQNVFLSGSNRSIAKERNIIEDMLSLWIDGIILVPVYEKKSNHTYINNIKTPIVILNREIEGVEKDLVMFDNLDGGFKATSLLIKKGYKNIAILSGPDYSRSFKNRFLGYRQALEGEGLFKEELVFKCDYSASAGYGCMKKALESGHDIEAVFASSDLIAFGAVNAINEKKIDIPGDISIIGFGDIYLSKYLNPPLTTVKRPFYSLGKRSAEVLLDRSSGTGKKDPQRFIIKGDLEIRKSVSSKGGESI